MGEMSESNAVDSAASITAVEIGMGYRWNMKDIYTLKEKSSIGCCVVHSAFIRCI